MKRIICLLLAAMLLLGGCSFLPEEPQAGKGLDAMPYTHPDMAEHDRILEESCETALSSTDINKTLDAVYAYYEVYDALYTAYNLANIHAWLDMKDTYWAEEYAFCAENTALADAGLEELYTALAQSPIREELEGDDYFGPGYFDGYEDGGFYNEALMALLTKESELEAQYYSLSAPVLTGEDMTNVTALEELFVELVALRQQIAAQAGYDSYADLAYEYFHYRDYTPAQAEPYLLELAKELSPLYTRVCGGGETELFWGLSGEAENLAYVEECAGAVGGIVDSAFRYMKREGLYHISPGENKYDSSFEVYLLSYARPFVFVNPYGTTYDKLVFTHEFGHFVNDYACQGSYAGTDVAEVHSQALEYLSLCVCEDTEDMRRLQMTNSLSVFVEQAAYALFELRVYELEGEALTVENVRAICTEVGELFGCESWFSGSSYVSVPHICVEPMYVISYVVSNDVAMQLFQQELQEPGKGVATYRKCVYSSDGYLLSFAEEYGLESPFAPGRAAALGQTLSAELE